jgi:hypothetical protein
MVRPTHIFATIATCDWVDAGVGIVWWAFAPRGRYLVRVLDYDLNAMSGVNAAWIGALIKHGEDLVARFRPSSSSSCVNYVEPSGLVTLIELAVRAWRATVPADVASEPPIRVLSSYEVERWPKTLDERAAQVRPLVNSGTTVRVESGRSFVFRQVRTNHLAAALRNHRPGNAATASELLHAFVLGLLITQGGDRRETLPDLPSVHRSQDEGLLSRTLRSAASALAVLSSAPQGPPTVKVPLRAGPHVVNGEPVTIEPRGAGAAQGWGYIELPVGGHIIDDIRHNIQDPRVGVRVATTRGDY